MSSAGILQALQNRLQNLQPFCDSRPLLQSHFDIKCIFTATLPLPSSHHKTFPNLTHYIPPARYPQSPSHLIDFFTYPPPPRPDLSIYPPLFPHPPTSTFLPPHTYLYQYPHVYPYPHFHVPPKPSAVGGGGRRVNGSGGGNRGGVSGGIGGGW